MATWLGTKVQNTFKGILKISDDNTGITATPKAVESGDGATSAMELSSDRIIAKSGAAFEGNGSLITNIDTSNIVDFATDVAATSAVTANTAKVSNVVTDLSIGTKTTTTININSSDGTNATLPAATTSLAGVQTAADKIKLDNLEPFITIERVGNIGASQGCASDSEFLYVTGWNGTAHLRLQKYNKRTGDLVLTRDLTFPPDGTAVTQINGIHVEIDLTNFDNTLLYISAMNYPTTPKQSYVKIFNAIDLTFVSEHSIGTGAGGTTPHWSEDVKKRGSDFWIVWDDYKYATKYNSSWVWQADYSLSYSISGTHLYNSGVWVGDYYYCNIHESSTPETCDVYFWNGSSFDEVERLVVPNTGHTNQGMAKEPDLNIMWWAERNYPAVYSPQRHNVVKTTIPYK